MNPKSFLTLGLITLLAAATQATQERLAASIQEARVEAERTSSQLKSALDTLNALTQQKEGDLRGAFNAFSTDVPKTEAAAASTAAQVKWMAGDGRGYFNSWQNTIDGIANESLRKKAQKRLDRVWKSYDKVEASFQTANEKFQPFLSDLRDVQKTLVNDVTAGGVKAVRRTVSDANWRYQSVNKAIHNALTEMEKMEVALSPQAK